MLKIPEKYTLDNGLRVLLLPQKNSLSTIAQIFVNVGSKDESLKTSGISHFIEHMVFKGTKKRPTPKKLTEEIEKVGGQSNAYTGQEETSYWVKMPAKYSSLTLDIVSDIFLNPLFRREELEKERGVILQEMAMYEDQPMRVVEEKFYQLAYGNQPAGRKIIGSSKNIKNFSVQDLKKYKEKRYLPQSSVLVVAGKFNPAHIKKQIEKTFSALKKKRKPRRQKTIIKQKEPQLSFTLKKTDQAHLILGFHSFNLYHPQRRALELLSVVLGGGMSSRLFMEIREKKGLAYYVNAHNDFSQDSGLFLVQAGVGPENLEKAVKIILQELRKIVRKKISTRELRKAKERIKGGLTMGLETIQAQASFFGNQELFHNKLKSLKEILDEYEQVDTATIQKIATEVFVNNKLNLAVVGPSGENNKIKNSLKI